MCGGSLEVVGSLVEALRLLLVVLVGVVLLVLLVRLAQEVGRLAVAMMARDALLLGGLERLDRVGSHQLMNSLHNLHKKWA